MMTVTDTSVTLPCTQVEPELFFADTQAEIDVAKALCLDCALRAECFAGALRRSEPHGVWGGELFEEGRVIARKRHRGRPRKDALPIELPLPEPYAA